MTKEYVSKCPTCGGCGIQEEWFEEYDFEGNLIMEPSHHLCSRCNGSGEVIEQPLAKEEE